MKKILILGMDGYLGWSLAVHLMNLGVDYEISGADDFRRREWVKEVGSDSAIPIASMNDRLMAISSVFSRKSVFFKIGNLQDPDFVYDLIRTTSPETIVHFAEMPSAPYSMRSNLHALRTQWNNIATTLNVLFAMKKHCPNAHLVKIGSMGEYGIPNVPIPEGFFEVVMDGRRDVLPFPRQAGSWYHQSKVHDSHNIMFACKIWNLRSTDIMQGVVYGTKVNGMDCTDLRTRFDFDGDFGTAINRFVAQAIIGHPITPYGIGKQKRGFLPLRDSMQCLTLAIDNPPKIGQYRVLNQFEEIYSITDLASTVAEIADDFGLDPVINHVENPRKEAEEHFYEADHSGLLKLGYKPNHDMRGVLREMFTDLIAHKDRIKKFEDALLPSIRWSGENKAVDYLRKE